MTGSDVTCAWCGRDVEMGERHGEGVCTVSVPIVIDTSRLDAVLAMEARRSARRFDETLLAAVRDEPLLLSADTPLVSRSPHVPSTSSAYVLDGSMFADGQLRLVLAESTSTEVFDAVRAELEERAQLNRARSSMSGLLKLLAERFPCSYCRTVGGHAPTCITHLEPLLERIEGEKR